jgi:hypothetical protein
MSAAEESVSREEIAASVVMPHFCAVQDVFSDFEIEPGVRLDKLAKVKFRIEPKVHDKARHFAATYEDARLMIFAPEIVDLPFETLVAIMAHEFGHAADFAYPARWYTADGSGPTSASWIPNRKTDSRLFRQWDKTWAARNRDQIEWAADAIAQVVTGQKITYCGDCMLQTFSGGVERPKGLR